MRLAFVADGRSPHTRSWLDLFRDGPYELHLISTFACDPPPGVESFRVIPVAFSGRVRAGDRPPGGASAIGLRAAARHWLGPLTVPAAAARLRDAVNEIQPDLVHALRIPFEGMLAGSARLQQPLVISIWGNDLTLHAGTTPSMRVLTRRALRAADGLHADCDRDLRLARGWGFRPGQPSIVLPGGGGIDTQLFRPGQPDFASFDAPERSLLQGIPQAAPVVVNPRGFRAYVRNDTFFRSIPGVLEKQPATVFLCPAMQGEPAAERWLDALDIRENVHLLPRLGPLKMAAIYQRARVMVSPSTHDGTPNSFLEAIACGCLPVVSDLESLREWVTDGSNGLLIAASDPAQLAAAIIRGLQDDALLRTARASNKQLIDARASRAFGLAQAEALYRQLAAAAPLQDGAQ